MRYAITNPGEKISALAARLYETETRADARKAEEALREANPALEGRRELPPGLVVEVPELAEAAPTAEAKPPTELAGAAGLHLIRAVLPGIRDQVAEAVDDQVRVREERKRVAQQRELKARAAEDEAVAERVEALRKRADEALAEARALRTEHKAGLSELSADLDDLLELFG
jgi:murein DD-endopeptidase MepM/ murein hydrolase activator NlpD